MHSTYNVKFTSYMFRCLLHHLQEDHCFNLLKNYMLFTKQYTAMHCKKRIVCEQVKAMVSLKMV